MKIISPLSGTFLPDYEERMRAGIEWCRAHGYTPWLVSDILNLEN